MRLFAAIAPVAAAVMTFGLAAAPAPAQEVAGRVFGVAYSGRGIKYVDARSGGELYPVNINNWWGHINERGDLVIFPRYDWTDHSIDSFARAVYQGKTGWINLAGFWYIEPIYPYADRFSQQYAIVGDGKEKFGVINKAGRLIVPIKLDGALRFKDGYAAVRVGDKCGFINVAGQVAIKPQYARVRSFHENMAMVQMFDDKGRPEGPIGYIDEGGNRHFIDRVGELTDAGDFNEDLARVRIGAKWGYIDRGFKPRIAPQFEDARDFTNGVAAVKLNGKWGFIDKTGRFAVAPQFEWADDLDDVLAGIVLNNRIGFVNRVGNYGIHPQFTSFEPFFRNYARVSVEPSFGYIDVSGRIVWDPRAPFEGIQDLTTRGKVDALFTPHVNLHIPGTRLIRPPAFREAPREPTYPPEYLYEEVLPQPKREQ